MYTYISPSNKGQRQSICKNKQAKKKNDGRSDNGLQECESGTSVKISGYGTEHPEEVIYSFGHYLLMLYDFYDVLN